jgi:5'-methylthioadenosine phosphorylase
MGRLAVIGGHSILGSGYGTTGSRVDASGVEAGAPTVAAFDAGTHVVLHRHGVDTYTAAHRVDHVAHVRALASMGCDRILAISSVGGLHPGLGVGTMVMPDDFIALDSSISVFHDERSHIVPEFDPVWRSTVLRAARNVVPDGEVFRDAGVYWQSIGPRFETRAEIRFIARFADVVGMTAASESIAAQELGLPYAVICVVDNLANGIAETPLTREEFETGKRTTRSAVLALLDAIVPALAE